MYNDDRTNMPVRKTGKTVRPVLSVAIFALIVCTVSGRLIAYRPNGFFGIHPSAIAAGALVGLYIHKINKKFRRRVFILALAIATVAAMAVGYAVGYGIGFAF